MSNCLFPSWCLPKSLEFLKGIDVVEGAPLPPLSSSSSSSISKVDGAGVLQIPNYRKLPKDQSKLLQACWNQNWENVLWQCHQHPNEACHLTQRSRRTALHLATFNHPCPLPVAQALLNANRHMVLVQDANWYTPLHNVALFRGGESLVKLVCDTAIMVAQEVNGQEQLPPLSGTSPLFLAAKRAAPLRTLRQLLETRTQQRCEWIAPSTGAEPYWMETLDEYSSPLEILLRDRAVATWGLQRGSISIQQQSTEGTNASPLPASSFSSTLLRPRLLWQMKQIAIQRLRTVQGRKQARSEAEMDQQPNEGPCGTKNNSSPSCLDENDNSTTEEETQALSLWAKCIELLAEHMPRLLRQQHTNVEGDTRIPAEQQCVTGGNEFAIVHCVTSAKVPLPNLLQVSLMVFPEQALMRDEYGMLPLHHVLYAKHPYATKTLVGMLLNHAPQAVLYSCSHQYRDVMTCTSSAKDQDDENITAPFPSSSILPLHLALELGLSLDLLKDLLWADSDATLTTVDPRTGFYPFAVAALKGYDLDVIYTLLNAHPQVLLNHLVPSTL